MKLGEKISTQRRKMGLSQEELAARLNVTRQAVSKWETGTSVPELETLVALARTFGVTTDYLLSDGDPVEAAPQQSQQEYGNPDILDRLPGFFSKIFRRYGWLGGVYLAVGGLMFTGLGALSRYMVNRMFSGFGFPTQYGGLTIDPFTGEISNMVSNNPVSLMGGFIMVVGIVMMIVGVILAVWLKKRGK